MKKMIPVFIVLITVVLTAPLVAVAEPLPESIGEKIAVKFSRGLANTVTCPAEIPKQIELTGQEMGPVGYLLIGPLKGIGMTAYRGFIGAVEMVFSGVPQPGYYDPTIDPPYVWEGWESKRDSTPPAQ